ncbi:hypothetical protein V6N13_115340 [Hibiscus sabdariffa]|uniref:Uncharacterized protein n=1 Tax=Hibiscus sabdariffa TaxID=183260 RepID=A0ABR2CRF5_9ROSI
MTKFTLIALLSFVLVLLTQSVIGHDGHIKDFVRNELSSAVEVTKETTSSLDGEGLSSNELKKIGTHIKEAFQNMKSAFNEALSPEQEEQVMENKEKDSSEEGDNGAPSYDGEELYSNELKKIGTEIKQAVQNIESIFFGALSPEQEEQIMKNKETDSLKDDELSPSEEGDGDAPLSYDDEELAPSSKDSDAPPLDDEEIASSLGDGDAPISGNGEEFNSTSKDDE